MNSWLWPKEHGLGELVRALDLIELLLDGLPEFQIVIVFQNEERLGNLPSVEVLAGITELPPYWSDLSYF
jgi:hypothetical protein